MAMNGRKSGQVTIFIILGLILLTSMGVYMYYSSVKAEKIQAPEIVDAATLNQYVSSCLDATAKEVIVNVSLQGGMYNPAFYKTWHGKDVEYWCYGEAPNQCVNTAKTKDDISQQIIEGIKDKINYCLDLHLFEAQGYKIQKGIKEGTATMSNDNIQISFTYPLTLKKETEEVTVKDFQTTISSPLAQLYNTALLILNQEALSQTVDIMDYELNHTNIIITKQKPYPGTIYIIKKQDNDLALQFAVQGIDTAATPGEITLSQDQTYGCCYVGLEKDCYANTPKTTCEQKAGRYEAVPCACPISEAQTQSAETCNGGDCKNCGSKKHGESWCSYDGKSGEGKDAVGSRQTMYYCDNGEMQEEQCRDYREEICVQENILIKNTKATKALCRPNRWQDCAACTTQSCCENTEERDCYWNPDLAALGAGRQCTPYVPSGLKFWDFNGLEICSRANQETTCNGLSCEQEWVNAAAISCYSQGDCGNWRNTEGILTKNSFFTTDFKHDPEESIYNLQTQADPITSLPVFVGSQKELLNQPVGEAADIFLEMITSAYRFVNQWVDVTIPNYLNPFTKKPKIEIAGLSFCSTWQAPAGKDACSQCTGKDGAECTEYKCHSLGKKCVYEEQNGYPTCTAVAAEKEKSFSIAFDESALPSAYHAIPTTLAVGNATFAGYRITPALTPYQLFTLGVTSTEETVCRLDYTPEIQGFDTPSFLLGNPEYKQQHLLSIRVPSRIVIPGRLKEGLNLTTADQIVSALLEPQSLLESYQSHFPAVFEVYKTVTGNDLAEELNPYVQKMLTFENNINEEYPYYQNLSTTLLEKFDSGGYYLFVSCEDKHGNPEQQQFFVEVNVANDTEDTTAPSIVAFSPENNKMIAADAATVPISVYTNEPAECRYDTEDKTYEAMQYALTCQNSIYDLVPVAGGSYQCTTTLPITTDKTLLYMRCADQPKTKETYMLSIQYANTTGVDGNLYSAAIPEDVEDPLAVYADYISVVQNNQTNQTEINMSAYLLSNTDATIFNVTSYNSSLTLYRDADTSCTLVSGADMQIMECRSTTEKENKGRYACHAELAFNNSENSEEYPRGEYTITCGKAAEQNVNEDSAVYMLTKSPGLEITAVTPGNNEEVGKETAVTVTTSASEDITCGYSLSELDYLSLKKLGDTVFSGTIINLESGYQTIFVHCKDGLGNTADATSSFYVMQG